MGGLLDSSKSERHVLLMKCPPMVSRSLKSPLSSSSYFSGGPSAKVIVTLDPLLPNDDFSSTQVGNYPNSLYMYILSILGLQCRF